MAQINSFSLELYNLCLIIHAIRENPCLDFSGNKYGGMKITIWLVLHQNNSLMIHRQSSSVKFVLIRVIRINVL